MSGTYPPERDPITGQPLSGGLPSFLQNVDLSSLVRGNAPAPAQPSILGGGLAAGYQNVVGAGGAALSALGRATGIEPLERYGREVAEYRGQRAQEVGRPDLETAPWREGGAPVLPWLGYTLASQAPQIGATLASAYLARGLPIPNAAAAQAARVPAVLGGAGARSAAAALADDAALATGRAYLGAAAAGAPLAAGQMYGEALERGERPGYGEALAALGLSPVYAAAEAAAPLRSFFGPPGAGNLARRVATGAARGATTEFGTEGFQTTLEQGFRPDLTLAQRANNIIDGALTGAAVGGVFGGVGGVRRMRQARDVDPAATTNQDLQQTVDAALTPGQGAQGELALGDQPILGPSRPEAPAAAPVENIPTTAQPTPAMAEFPLEQPPREGTPDLFAPEAAAVPEVTPQRLVLGLLAQEGIKDSQVSRRLADRFTATNPVDLAEQVDQRLTETKAADTRLLALARSLGLDRDLTQLQADLDKAQRDVERADATTRPRLEAQLARVTQQVAIRNELDARAAEQVEAERVRQPLTIAQTEAAAQPDLFGTPAAVPAAAPAVVPIAAPEVAAAQPALPGLEPSAQIPLPLSPPVDRRTRLEQIIADPASRKSEVRRAEADLRRLDRAQANAEIAVLPETMQPPLTTVEQPSLVQPELPLGSTMPWRDRISTLMQTQGLPEDVTARARNWLIRFDVTGMAPDMQQEATDIIRAAATSVAPAQEAPGAVQERRPARVDVQPPAQTGGEVAGRDTQERPAPARPEAPAAQETAAVPPGVAPAPATPVIEEGGGRRDEEGQADGQRGQEDVTPVGGVTTAPPTTQAAPEADSRRRVEESERGALLAVLDDPDVNPQDKRRALNLANAPTLDLAETNRFLLKIIKDRIARREAQERTRKAQEEAENKAKVERQARIDNSDYYADMKRIAADEAAGAGVRKRARDVMDKVERGTATRETSTEADKVVQIYDNARARVEAAEQTQQPATQKWAEDYKNDTMGFNAFVVYADENYALVRNFTQGTFNTIYQSINRATGRHLVYDITSDFAKNAFGAYPADVRQRLLAAKNRAVEADTQAYERAPDGPFANLKGDDKVASTASIAPQTKAYLADLLRTVGLGNLRVFVYTADDVLASPAQYNLNGPYARALRAAEGYSGDPGGVQPFGPNGKDFRLILDPALSPAQQVQTIAHEVGHIIETVALRSAPAEAQRAVMADYSAWRERTKGASAKDLIRSLRTPDMAERAVGKIADDLPATGLANYYYWTSFSEWFADNVAKWAITNERPRGIVEKFFKAVADKFRKLVASLSGDQLPSQSVSDFLATMTPNNPAVWEGIKGKDIPPAQNMAAPTVRNLSISTAAGQVNQTASTMMQNASRWADSALSLGPQELRRGVRNAALYVSSLYNVVRTSGDLFQKFNDAPSITGAKNLLENIYNLHRRRSAVSARFSAIVNDGWTEYNRLQATDPKAGAVLNKVMDATAFGINPEKKWNDPEHASLKGRRNEAWLKAAVDEANQNIVRLKQNGGLGYKVYTEMRNTSDMTHYASMAVTLQNLINSDPIYRGKISAFETDPMQAFLDSPALHQDAAKAKAFWRQQLDQRVQAARKYLVDMTGRDFDMTVKKPVDGAPAEQSHINILRKRLGTIDSRLKAMDRVPYFHLGRVGKYFASFNVRTKEVTDAKGKVTKVPDQAALQRIAEVVEGDGFNNFRISPEVDKATVFLRVETADQLDRLKSILAPLTKDGTISGDVKAGDRLDPSKAVGADAEFLNEAMQRIKSSPMFEADDPADQKALDAQRGKMVSLLAEVWINMLPDTAEARVMTKRDAIAGWSSDMARSYAERMNIGILALANLSTAAPMSATFAAMRQNINDAKLSSSNVSTNNVLRMQDVFNELRTREVETNNVTGNDWIDTFRAINYAYFLGASPAYVLTNLTQIPIILLPELARKHGFANSAKAIARNTGLAMNIMKEVFKQGWDISARQAADASITNKALDAVLKDDTPANNATKEFILRLVNTGIIDIGNAARELGRVAEGRGDSRMDNILRYAGAMGLYSETFSRLMAALASRDLIEQKIKAGKQGYSQDMLLPETLRIVDETMLNYSAYNIARATGRQGALGRATPIATSFNQYSFQVLEKLYRDMYDAFSSRRPGEDDTQFAARRSEARTFLFSHAAMLTVLAGSLGLPFATVAAAAANSLKDLFDDDDQPADVVAAYRNYLSQMLGKDAAEVLARGVPRALGFDMSARVGEQNILPFSRFLSDRRKWEDTFPELMADLAGSPFGMVGNVAVGLREMANGNTLEGMQTLLPTALRNVTAAYRMTERGYTDTRTGQALPMEAGARDVLTQLIGFAPAELAEYREARVAQASREGIIGRQATNIRTNIAKAIEGGDAAAAREWIARAREFDANNPTSAILPRIGSVIQQRALARAQAEAGNVPLGVNLRDINARQLTAYANF
jgi:hypothetical protein